MANKDRPDGQDALSSRPHVTERKTQRKEHAEQRETLRAEIQRQKDTTAHYVGKDASEEGGKPQIRQAMDGKDGSRPDDKILSHGFNAEANGPVKQNQLEARQAQESAALKSEQHRQRGSWNSKGRMHGFNRAAKDTGRGRS